VKTTPRVLRRARHEAPRHSLPFAASPAKATSWRTWWDANAGDFQILRSQAEAIARATKATAP